MDKRMKEELSEFEREGLIIAHTKFKHLTRGQQIAQLVSVILSPNVVCPFAFIWFLIHYEMTPFWEWASGAIYFYGIHPLVLPALFALSKRGDIYVTDRRQRFWPFASAIVGYVFFLGFIVIGFGWENLLTRVIAGSTLLSIFLLFISLRWKISIHATGNSVAIAGLAVLNPLTLWFTLPLHILVLWARYKVKAHTMAQLFTGTLLGFAVPLCVIFLVP